MLIDTNVYSALDRGKPSAIKGIAGQGIVLVPFCVIGELQFGFALGKNSEDNEVRLERFLSQTNVEILIPTKHTCDLYGQLAAYCRARGKALPSNKLWIAALAVEHGARLLTYDKDFMVLTDKLGEKLTLLED